VQRQASGNNGVSGDKCFDAVGRNARHWLVTIGYADAALMVERDTNLGWLAQQTRLFGLEISLLRCPNS
jgi:hypothetical protein